MILVGLASFPVLLLSLILVSRRVESALCLALLCLLQSIEERVDAYSEHSSLRLQRL
jgi:hypothetical protein